MYSTKRFRRHAQHQSIFIVGSGWRSATLLHEFNPEHVRASSTMQSAGFRRANHLTGLRTISQSRSSSDQAKEVESSLSRGCDREKHPPIWCMRPDQDAPDRVPPARVDILIVMWTRLPPSGRAHNGIAFCPKGVAAGTCRMIVLETFASLAGFAWRINRTGSG